MLFVLLRGSGLSDCLAMLTLLPVRNTDFRVWICYLPFSDFLICVFFCYAGPSSSSVGAASDVLSLDHAIDQVGVTIKHAKKSLEMSVQTLGSVFKEVLPTAEVPSTIAGLLRDWAPSRRL